MRDVALVTFTVHEPPDPPADRIDRADGMVFVKDGFSLHAALLTPFWLAGRRQWIALAVYAAGLALLAGTLFLLKSHPTVMALWIAAYHLLWGYEADEIERATLASRGFETVGTVSGRSEAECERRFFENWLPRQPILTPAAPAPPAPPPPAAAVSAQPERMPLWRRWRKAKSA